MNWLMLYAINHEYLVYLVIALVSFVEGPILGILCGLILRLGFLDFIPAYVALMVGDLMGDIVWYWIGRKFGHGFIKRFGKYFSVTEENVTVVERIFHRYKNRILLISKVTMGLGFALVTLITAGMVRIPFRQYISMNVIGQFVWTGFLILLGYFVGNLYVTFDNVFARVSIISGSIILIVALFGYGKFIRSRFVK